MKRHLVSLIFLFFSSIAFAEEMTLEQLQSIDLNGPTLTAKINAMTLNLGERERKVIEEINSAIGSNDKTSIGFLMSKEVWKGIKNQTQRRFWAAVLYIAFNFVNEVGCNTRNFWFLSKIRVIDGKSMLIKKSACEKQVEQNLIVGGVNGQDRRKEIKKEYCEVFFQNWSLYENIAIAYYKAVGGIPTFCKN